MNNPPSQRTPRPPKAADLSEDTIKQMLGVQAAEIQLRRDELELRGQELKHNKDYAEKMLSAQERDRADERNHSAKTFRYRLIATVIALGAILAFCGYAVSAGKDELVKDIIKMVLPSLVTGVAGYYVGKNKKDESSED